MTNKYQHIWPNIIYDGINVLPLPNRNFASCGINQALIVNEAFDINKEFESLLNQGWIIKEKSEGFFIFMKETFRLIVSIKSFDEKNQSITVIILEND